MATQTERAETFTKLHVPGNPVILYNIWDAGSAKAVVEAGATAIATGSHGVANSFGHEDGEDMPLELAIENAKRVVAASNDLPVTMDIETGYGTTPEDVTASAAKIIATGIVGINIEDQIIGTSDLQPIDVQIERIAAVRKAADEAGVPIHINARSDIFKTDPSTHTEVILEQALERAQAYHEAGGNSFFVPGLRDINLIKQLCERSPLPVNIIWLDGMVSTKELAEAGVARISYGPGPYLNMIEWLKDGAAKALNSLQ